MAEQRTKAPGMKSDDHIKVVVLQRVRQQFEWQLHRNGTILAKGISSSVAQARLDGEAVIPRAQAAE
jgi:hypothetical protein